MPYITQADLEARISADKVKAIYDDDADGDADADPIERLILDAQSKVDGYLRGIYTLPLAAPYPNEIVRLTLDVAEAYAAKRHPEYVRRDWVPLLEAAERDLRSLRRGDTRLDVVSTPEPAANEGGSVRSGNVDSPTVPDPFFKNGLGDF